MNDEEMDGQGLDDSLTPEDDEPNPSPEPEIKGAWDEAGEIFTAEDGRRFREDEEGNTVLIEDESDPEPEPEPEPEPSPHTTYAPPSDDLRAKVRAAVETFDPDQITDTLLDAARQIANDEVQTLVASQGFVNPLVGRYPELAAYTADAQEILRTFVKSDPAAASDKKAHELAFIQAATKRGYATGDVAGEVAKVTAILRKQKPAASTPPKIPPSERMTAPRVGGAPVPSETRRENPVEKYVNSQFQSDEAKRAYKAALKEPSRRER